MSVVTRDKIDGAISRITLNRPERLNAMSFGLVAEFHDALDEVASDVDCKVVILTGAGRGFCAGLDLRGVDQRQAGGRPDQSAADDQRAGRRDEQGAEGDAGREARGVVC